MKKNFIWTRDPSEAYSNPYEYAAQEQFSREAYSILIGFKERLESFNRTFQREDKSLKKANWMLLVDATDSLLECHAFILNKNHKIAGRLFRDAIEVIDLSALFQSKTDKSQKLLEKWYNDEVIPNREFRNYISQSEGKVLADKYRNFYSNISKFNHRTYRTLAYGYILNKNGTFVYDGFASDLNDSNFLVFPGVISMYYALLGNLISILSISLLNSGLVSKTDLDNIWEKSIEKEVENRRFVTNEDLVNERLDHLKNEKNG